MNEEANSKTMLPEDEIIKKHWKEQEQISPSFKTELAAFVRDIKAICDVNIRYCSSCPLRDKYSGCCSMSLSRGGRFDIDKTISTVETYRKHKKPCTEVIDRAMDIKDIRDEKPVVRGEWKEIDRDVMGEKTLQCGRCGQQTKSFFEPNFCHHCGADMQQRGESKQPMSAVEYLETVSRFLSWCDERSCDRCKYKNNCLLRGENETPEERVEIIKKWAQEHPERSKTNGY